MGGGRGRDAVGAAGSSRCAAGDVLSGRLGSRGRIRAWHTRRDGQVAHLLRPQGAEAGTRGTGACAMSDPSCRTFRELLGVYVVGAIEPAERAAVDAHLSQCYECREELAALARLPALLHRVHAAEAERILLTSPPQADPAEPSAEILASLLARVVAKRRTRRFRRLFAAPPAGLIAVGGGGAVSEAACPPPRT